MYGMYGGMGGMGGMGGLGGLGGMGGMYGGGMYGGGMGGLGGMGMGSSMYGGGMYGGGMGGLGSPTYGSSGGNMFQNYGSNGMGGIGNGQMTDQNGVNIGGGQPNSILPGGAEAGPLSPIHQTEPLPPLNETPAERGRRIRAEQRKEKQLIKQQREQRRQQKLQARMVIAGHLTNMLVQTLRSSMEMFAVCFGTYYSIKAVRAFATTSEQSAANRMAANAAAMGVAKGANNAGNAVAAPAPAPSGWSKWKTGLLFGVLFIVGEIAYSRIARSFSAEDGRRSSSRKSIRDAYESMESEDDFDTFELDGPVEEDDEDATTNFQETRRAFVALYDYTAEGEEDDQILSFKAGDQFFVKNYTEGNWCEAVAMNGSPAGGSVRGLVPGNFLRAIEHTTKL